MWLEQEHHVTQVRRSIYQLFEIGEEGEADESRVAQRICIRMIFRLGVTFCLERHLS